MDFVDLETTLTFTTAVTLTGSIVSVVKFLTKQKVAGGWSPPWFTLATALAMSLLRAGILQTQHALQWFGWVLAVVNGFVICAAAIGANTLLTSGESHVDDGRSGPGRILLTRW
jgi:predicted membrane protein